jgi:hypothetical protein
MCRWGTDPDCGGICVPSTNPPPADAGTTGPQRCGGNPVVPLPPCAQGYYCAEDTTCADCEGTCVPNPNVPIICGGLVPNPVTCPTGTVCVDNPNGPSMTVDGTGLCIKRMECAGLLGLSCPAGMACVDDPSDNCDPANGGADCGGYCVLNRMQAQCAGLAGLQCPASLRCVDNPNDNCDPLTGGADCNGVCVP